MIWALISRFNDVLAVLGLGTVLYWSIKITVKITRAFAPKETRINRYAEED